jgi:hypothetical protein
MGDKNLDTYGEELTPEHDGYHIIKGGNFYLINFTVNKTNLLVPHQQIVDRKVVRSYAAQSNRSFPVNIT